MYTNIENMFVYTEFAERKVFKQLTLALACFARSHHGSQEVSISECNVTWTRVMVERYCLPATAIHAISNVTFPAFDFSIASYEAPFSTSRSILFFKTKQRIIRAFIWNQALGAVHLNSPSCYVALRNRHFSLAGRRRTEETSANVSKS